jgi:hypothetical protein
MQQLDKMRQDIDWLVKQIKCLYDYKGIIPGEGNEEDPIFTASPAAGITQDHLTLLANISGDKHFLFTQGTVSDTWTIPHPLEKFPAITVVDNGGTIVEGQIVYIDDSNLTITFSTGFSGKAYLN